MSIEEMFGYIMTNIGWFNLIITVMFVANGVTFYQMFKKLNEQKAIIENLNNKLIRKL